MGNICKIAVLMIFFFFNIPIAYANEKNDITQMCNAYFQCLQEGNYKEISEYFAPNDLELFQKICLTAIRRANDKASEEERQSLNKILSDSNLQLNRDITASEFLSILFTYVINTNRDADILQQIQIKITSIYFKADNDHAIVEYDMIQGKDKHHDLLSVIRINNRWYLDMQPNLKNIWDSFKELISK
jgi:hypothetical protein